MALTVRHRAFRWFLLTGAWCICLLFAAQQLNAQQRIGGPYEADSSTVLLLHFNGDYQNEVDATADPRPHGNTSFEKLDSAGVFGQQLRLDNDSPADKSHLQVPDTSTLDLTGSWTMEAWVLFFSFCPTQDCLPKYPRILFKPGDVDTSRYYLSNYFINAFSTRRSWSTGYYSPSAGTWVEIRSPYNILGIGEWYHVTFIRDTSKKMIVQMIHQNASDPGRLPGYESDSLELLHLEAFDYEEAGQLGSPQISSQPLFIGATPQNDTLYGNLDGWLDEIRISNTVRNYRVPPLITGVTELENQTADHDYQIEATIETIGDNTIAAAELHYRVDEGGWQTLRMSEETDNRYTARIPSQPVGSRMTYWVEARTGDGQQTRQPSTAPTDSVYQFGVWSDSTRVLHLPFDEGSGNPVDQSFAESEITFHSNASGPTYADGDAGEGDQAMVFNATNSTWLEVSSPFHDLTNFTLEFKFMARDSLPLQDTRLIAKGDQSTLYYSNYQIYFDPNGAVRPAIYAADNGLDPCGEFTGGCLLMDGTNEHIEAETWYRVQLGIREPEGLVADTGRIFAHLLEVASGDTIAKRVHPVDAGARPNANSLMIGGTGGSEPYFNGLIDDLSLYNYIPSRIFTDTPARTDPLPRQITLSRNYPNPFNPTTTLRFSLPRASHVQLTVYNSIGQKVSTLIRRMMPAGNHSTTFNASGLSSGVYIYRLKAGDHTESKKMLLLQ